GARRPAPRVPAARARRGASWLRGAVRAQWLDRPAGHGTDLGRGSGVGLLVAARPGRGHPERRLQRHLELLPRRRRLPGTSADRAGPAGAVRSLAAVRLLPPADAGSQPDGAGALALRRSRTRSVSRL